MASSNPITVRRNVSIWEEKMTPIAKAAMPSGIVNDVVAGPCIDLSDKATLATNMSITHPQNQSIVRSTGHD